MIKLFTHTDLDGIGCAVLAKLAFGKDVAKLFGGGGHPKSAGSKFDQSIKLDIVEKIFKQ